MKKILCLTDFSQASANAARYAAWLSRELDAELTLLHVLQTQAMLHGMLSAEKATQVDQKLKEAEQELKKLKDSLQADSAGAEPPLKCNTITGEGLLWEVTEYFCEQYNFELVIMGTTGGAADTLEDLLIGSNTIELFDKLRWPVLSIPGSFHRHHLHRIVFATDYQEKDRDTCREIIQFASPFCAQVHLLHVNPDKREEHEHQLVNFAKTLVTSCGLDRLHFSQISDEDLERGVLSYAEEIEADMLVMTGKETGFFDRFFKQSLTELAAYHAQVPLLVFPASWKTNAQYFTRVEHNQKM